MKFSRLLFCAHPILMSTVFAALPSKQLHTITNPRANPQELDHYGSSVVANSTWIVSGIPRGEPFLLESGRVHVRSSSYSTSSYTSYTFNNPIQSGGGAFGASVAIASDTLLVGAPENAISGVGLQGSAYLYNVVYGSSQTPMVFQSPVVESFEYFGRAVAVSPAYAAISGAGINTAAAGAGIVHVYDLASATPAVPVFSLPNPSPAAGESFGHALVINGTSLFVSDPSENGGKGQVWVYDLASGTPNVPTLVIPSPMTATENEHFGHALAVDAGRLVVGAPEGLGLNGRAYVFNLASSTPAAPVQSYANPDPFIWEAFGSAVAIRGSSVAIGCPSDILMGNFIGSVYYYDLAGATPHTPAQNLQSPVAVSGGESFGTALAFSITENDLIIGAPGNDAYAGNSGDAYRFTVFAGGTPTFHVGLNQRRPTERFGRVADIHGDTLVVAEEGYLYVYNLSSGTPETPVQVLLCLDPSAGDVRPVSIAIQGTRVVIGMEARVGGLQNAGRAYLLDLSNLNSPWLVLQHTTPTFNGRFGASVDIDGNHVVVGAPGHRQTHVFDLANATPATALHVFKGGDSESGISVSLSGSLLAVGSEGMNNRVLIYNLAHATPATSSFSILMPSSGLNRTRLSLSGQRLLVGIYNRSYAQVYQLNATSATFISSLDLPDNHNYSDFGHVVSLEGTRAYVGVKHLSPWSTERAIIAYGYDLAATPPNHPRVALTQFSTGDSAMNSALAQGGNRVIAGVPFIPHANQFSGGVVNVYTPAAPELSVEVGLNVQVSSPHASNLGLTELVQEKPFPIFIRNLGADPLQIFYVQLGSIIPTEFTGPMITIPPGGTHSYTGVSIGGSYGPMNEVLRFTTNDEDEPVFDFNFTGTLISAQQLWRHQHFGTTESTGQAADNSDPDGDGQTNATEFLVGALPLDTHSRLQLHIQDDPAFSGRKRITISPPTPPRTFTRPSVQYLIEASDTLINPWQSLLNKFPNDEGETISITDFGSFGRSARFYRLIAN